MESLIHRWQALVEFKAGAQAMACMLDVVREGSLGRPTTLGIALYLTKRGYGISHIESLRAMGRTAGINGAEMSANQQGTSHDAKISECLRFVKTLVDDSMSPRHLDLCRMTGVGYSHADVVQVMALVDLSIRLTACRSLFKWRRSTRGNCCRRIPRDVSISMLNPRAPALVGSGLAAGSLNRQVSRASSVVAVLANCQRSQTAAAQPKLSIRSIAWTA